MTRLECCGGGSSISRECSLGPFIRTPCWNKAAARRNDAIACMLLRRREASVEVGISFVPVLGYPRDEVLMEAGRSIAHSPRRGRIEVCVPTAPYVQHKYLRELLLCVRRGLAGANAVREVLRSHVDHERHVTVRT